MMLKVVDRWNHLRELLPIQAGVDYDNPSAFTQRSLIKRVYAGIRVFKVSGQIDKAEVQSFGGVFGLHTTERSGPA